MGRAIWQEESNHSNSNTMCSIKRETGGNKIDAKPEHVPPKFLSCNVQDIGL
jgi:hypothetical protein